MRNGNVLTFPASGAKHFEALGQRSGQPEQLSLFAGDYEKVAAITFIGLEDMDQDILLRSIIKHSIKTIIDLRSKPIFPKPRFDHKYIMSYFYSRSMNYIECAMSRSSTFEPRPLGRAQDCDHLDRWISGDASPGITACIVDAAAIESGAVAAFRHCVSTRTKMIELHPRALA